MYPTFAGVVIPDDDDSEQAIMWEQNYGQEDDAFVQVMRPQQYGSDGIKDGAEGLGMAQAQRLKAKLGRRGRKLRVGRVPYAVVGGSRFDYGFGVAPIVGAAAVKLATGGRVLGVSFKKGRPRMFGGPLVDTVNDVRANVEGLSTTRGGVVGAIQQMDRDRKSAKDKAAWQRIWREVLPTWRYTPQGYALIKSLDAGFPGLPPGGAVSTVPAISPPSAAPTLYPSPVPAPVPGPVLDAGGAPAPYFPPVPSPISPAASGGPTASETVAAAANGGTVEPVQAGMVGGIDLKNPMVLMSLAGVGLFIISQFTGSGTQRRRRSRR